MSPVTRLLRRTPFVRSCVGSLPRSSSHGRRRRDRTSERSTISSRPQSRNWTRREDRWWECPPRAEISVIFPAPPAGTVHAGPCEGMFLQHTAGVADGPVSRRDRSRAAGGVGGIIGQLEVLMRAFRRAPPRWPSTGMSGVCSPDSQAITASYHAFDCPVAARLGLAVGCTGLPRRTLFAPPSRVWSCSSRRLPVGLQLRLGSTRRLRAERPLNRHPNTGAR